MLLKRTLSLYGNMDMIEENIVMVMFFRESCGITETEDGR